MIDDHERFCDEERVMCYYIVRPCQHWVFHLQSHLISMWCGEKGLYDTKKAFTAFDYHLVHLPRPIPAISYI